MTQIVKLSVLLVLLVGIGLGLNGCKDDGAAEGQPTGASEKVPCPVCGMKMKVDTYCGCCTAVAAATEMIHCEACDKELAAGEYCAACQQFMFNEKVPCEHCGEVAKGSLCPEEKVYHGLATVGYCATCERPFHPAMGCEACAEKEKAQ